MVLRCPLSWSSATICKLLNLDVAPTTRHVLRPFPRSSLVAHIYDIGGINSILKVKFIRQERPPTGFPKLLRARCLATITAVAGPPRSWKKRSDGAGPSSFCAAVACRVRRRCTQRRGRQDG